MQENVQFCTERQTRQRLWWLVPKAFDWLASTFYIGVFIVAFLPSPAGVVWWRVLLLAGVIFTLLLLDRLEYWRYGEQVPGRVAVILFTGRIVLIVCAVLLEGLNFTPFLFLLPPYLAVAYFGNRVGSAIAALAIAVYLLLIWIHDPSWYLKPLSAFLAITFSLAVVFVVLMARIVGLEKAGRRRAEELLAEVEQAHQHLQIYAERVAELATTEERNRVARDIHDGLGHALIAISVQLEKALVYYDTQPQEAFQAIRDAKHVAHDALQDVRRSVRALRAEHEPCACVQGITLLIDQLRASGLAVDFETGGSEESFPNAVRMTLYRVAQEGFTNIQKHAQASRVEAGLSFTEAEARLCIRDNGCGFDVRQKCPLQAASQGAYGLRGIQERVALIGGTFHLESQVGSGTTLLVTVTRRGVTGYPRKYALQEMAVSEEGHALSGSKSI